MNTTQFAFDADVCGNVDDNVRHENLST